MLTVACRNAARFHPGKFTLFQFLFCLTRTCRIPHLIMLHAPKYFNCTSSENIDFNSHYYRSGVWSVKKSLDVYDNIKNAGEFSRTTGMFWNVPECQGNMDDILAQLEH